MLAAKSLSLLVLESIRGFVHLSVSPSVRLLVHQSIHGDQVKSGETSILSLSLSLSQSLSLSPSFPFSPRGFDKNAIVVIRVFSVREFDKVVDCLMVII